MFDVRRSASIVHNIAWHRELRLGWEETAWRRAPPHGPALSLQVLHYQPLPQSTWDSPAAYTVVTPGQPATPPLQAIQPAFHPATPLPQHVGVDHRCGHVLVPQQLLNRPDVRAPPAQDERRTPNTEPRTGFATASSARRSGCCAQRYAPVHRFPSPTGPPAGAAAAAHAGSAAATDTTRAAP